MAYSQQAQLAGDAAFLPAQNALQLQQEQARIQGQEAIRALERWAQTGGEAISGAYDQFVGSTQQNQQASAQLWNDTIGQTAQGYQTGMQRGVDAQNQAAQYLEQLAHSTGGSFGRGMADAQAPGAQMFNMLQQIQGQEAQGRLSGLAAMGQGMDTMYRKDVDNARGAQAGAIAGHHRNVGQQIAKTNLAGMDNETKFMMQLQELLGKRGGFEMEYAQGLADRDSEASYKQAQMNMAAQQHAAELSLRAQAQAQEQSRWEAEHGLRAAAAGRENDNSWEKEKFYAALGLDKDKFNFEKLMAGQVEEEIPNYAGRQGAQLYLQDQNLPPEIADYVSNYMSGIAADPMMAGADPYSVMQGRNVPQFAESDYNRWGGSLDKLNSTVWRDLSAILTGNY